MTHVEIENVEIVSFVDMMNAISDDDAKDVALRVVAHIDERARYEASKNAENTSIQKHLNAARDKLSSARVARFMIAASVDESFINRNERVNARYNVYAVEKVASLAHSVAFDKSHNAINANVLRSMFKCTAAEIEFSHHLALCAASDKITCKDARARSRLSRHTVSASTASTQASSTMNALVTCNVVSEYRNAANETCYKLNDNALVTALRESLVS